jgi:Copper binding proteins, plastocyanin/azurin family
MVHTVRRLVLLAGVALAILAGARCNDDDDTIAGPVPQPTATPAPPGAPTPTPQPTATPAPPGAPTPTPTPVGNPVVDVGLNGGNTFVDRQSGTSTTTIRAGNTVHWIWVSGVHSTTSGSCPSGACQPDGLWDSGAGTGMTFDRTFLQPGTFPYYCTVHGSMMQGTVVVQ